MSIMSLMSIFFLVTLASFSSLSRSGIFFIFILSNGCLFWETLCSSTRSLFFFSSISRCNVRHLLSKNVNLILKVEIYQNDKFSYLYLILRRQSHHQMNIFLPKLMEKLCICFCLAFLSVCMQN